MTVSRSEGRLALRDAAFMGTPDPVALLALDGRLLDANRRALQFADLPDVDAFAHPLWQAPGWAARPTLASWLQRAVEATAAAVHAGDRAVHTREFVERDVSGRSMQFALRALPLHEPDAVGIQLVGLDVTEQLRAERRLAEREQRLQALTDHMHDPLFLVRVDADGAYRCESVNPAYLRVTGLTADALIERTLEEVLQPADAAIARGRYAEALAASVPVTYRETVTMPNGVLTVETTLTAIHDENGCPTHILGIARDVSQEEHALAALRASEARFRAALDAGRDAFVIVRAERDSTGAILDFVIVDANVRAAALVGESVAGIVGRSLLKAFPLTVHSGLLEQCSRVIATGVAFEMSQPSPLPEAPGRWVLRQIVPLGDGVAISSRDVTTRQLEQQALERSEARHRELFESSGAMQLIVDEVTGSLLDVNPAAEQFYGWPRETMRAMQITDLEALSLDAWRHEMRHGSTAPGRAKTRSHRLASGELREMEVASSMVTLLGRSAQHLILHDVSDRVRAEEQLRESEARFRAVVSGMSEGVVIHGADGTIRACNPSAERILGQSGEQLRGLSPLNHDWLAVREDGSAWPATEHPVMVALQTGKSQPRTLMGIRRGTAEHAWLHVSADPLLRPGSTVPYAAVAVFSDVTAQRSAEERLRQAQKLEAVGQLAGGIAHDFNNLLTVIRGASGFLVDSIEEGSPLLDDVRSIERAVERAEALTRQLLMVGRRQLLRTESVDLGALVQEQLATIRNELPRTIRLRVLPSAEPVLATLDRRQLLDALRALVDNARSAMHSGGELTISTALRQVERVDANRADSATRLYAVLEVRDTGVGMSEEIRDRLFEPFFSTQPFGANKGMGLASVHGMVAQSQGFIECDSSPGNGTTLRLFFPATTQEARAVTPPTSMRAIPQRGILMVDDDPMLRELGRRMLERLGHPATIAASGHEALAILEMDASKVSVLVTDLTMPGMAGMDLIAAVETLYPALPIVAISGFAMNPTVRQLLDARKIPFVGKPFTADDLKRALDRALESAPSSVPSSAPPTQSPASSDRPTSLS